MLSNLTNHKHVQNYKWPCNITANMQRKLWEDQHNGKQVAISREVSGFGSPCVLYRPIAPKLTKDLIKKKKKVSEPTTSFSKQKYQLRDLYKCFKQPQDYAQKCLSRECCPWFFVYLCMCKKGGKKGFGG